MKEARCKTTQFTRHSTKNEPPIPVGIALSVHAKTRNKTLIERLHSEGLSVSYDRVMSIRKQIASQICDDYQQKGFVCPPSLHSNIFTTAAIDNIDHNLSSTTAKSTIHWTGISIFQHPDEALDEKPSFKLSDAHNSAKLKRLELPAAYIDIQPIKPAKPEPPITPITAEHQNQQKTARDEAHSWITALSSDSNDSPKSFSAFYSRQQTKAPNKSIDALLPLVPEPITSHSVVHH